MSTEKNALDNPKTQVQTRNATFADITQICDLSERVYRGTGMHGYSEPAITGQINHFPEGQLVITAGDKVVGYCATLRVTEKMAFRHHTWDQITGNGYLSTHNPEGEWLYGMEVCVDPDFRGYRLGQRLYNARKQLVQHLGLKGIVMAGRLPSWHRKVKKFANVEEYVDAVVNKQQRDQVLSFQLRNGFELLGVMPNYLDADHQSMGYGMHLVWRNPKASITDQEKQDKTYGRRHPDSVRVGTVQYQQRKVASFEEFTELVRYFVDVVADYKGDFVVFPELFTLQLLSMEPQELSPMEAIEALTKYTPQVKELLRDLSLRYNINIIGGSHPTMMPNGRVENICYVCLRDGTVHEQAKIHPTPNEAYWWNIEGGNELDVIQTDCGPIGVLICYDSEFPELARHLTDQGAQILFVPFCTDERQGYLRVRYSCQARAVENQIFVALSGNCGNLPNVSNMDIQYAQSCILTPCDLPFARDGIAADTTPNTEMVAMADLRIDTLMAARHNGTVQNLKDRRHDLYSVKWKGK